MQDGSRQPTASEERSRGAVRGRWLVVGMLLFGATATAGISTYWKVRLGPYAPYRKALRAAFPDGAPTVEGGDLPGASRVLRIVLKVAYSPTPTDERTSLMADRVQEIAAQLDVERRYETMILFLVHPRPEKTPERLEIERPLH